MLFRQTRVARVTTEQELDSALTSADQVIVEGDDRLLSYAATKASRDPGNRVDVEVAGRSISVGSNTLGDSLAIEDTAKDDRARHGPFATDPSPAVAPAPVVHKRQTAFPRARRPVWMVAVLCAAIGLAAGAAFYWASPIAQHEVPAATSNAQAPVVPAPSPVPAIPQSLPNSGDTFRVLQSLAWPAVAIVAIAALFFIARQAIAGGRNVEITWKVTEKVAGRVVITKVRTRAGKARSSA
jgi:hypothetical protein